METIKETINNKIILELETDQEDQKYKYIYKCSWFDSKRHKKSHTDMYYENADDVKWIFETDEWFRDLARVEYIKVCNKSKYYQLASLSSKLCNNKDSNK
jgi:hypothetical protein